VRHPGDRHAGHESSVEQLGVVGHTQGVTDAGGRFMIESVSTAGTCELRLRAAS
jgi:hypothetical protein